MGLWLPKREIAYGVEPTRLGVFLSQGNEKWNRQRVYGIYPTVSCSAVALSAALHLATALPNFLTYEMMPSDWSKDQPNPLRHDLVQEPIEIFADGYMAPPPDKSGLDIELNEEVLRRYAVG